MLALVVERDVLENVAPIWAGKVGPHARPGYDVNSILCMVECLEHENEGGAGITLLVDAGAMVMELDHTISVLLGHIVHHPSEPLERTFLPGDPIEVGSLCHECLLISFAVATFHHNISCHYRSILFHIIIIIIIIQHIFKYAYQWSCSDAQPDEEEDVVLSIVLCRSTVRSIDPKLRKPD